MKSESPHVGCYIGVENSVAFAQAWEMNRIRISALAAAMVLLWGCGKPAAAPTPPATPPGPPTAAQPKLQTMKLWLGSEELVSELALTEMQQRTGMMFRTNMAENAGMLFVFGAPHRASFWMMNTVLPLSAAYIDPEGVILEIHDLQPHNTNEVVAASSRVQYVLETNQGWFKRHNIREGMVIRTERGTLQDTFFNK
jgi:uncharacterized membrane protein (UPF0127 family)